MTPIFSVSVRYVCRPIQSPTVRGAALASVPPTTRQESIGRTLTTPSLVPTDRAERPRTPAESDFARGLGAVATGLGSAAGTLFVGLAMALSVPFFPDTLSIYAFAVLEGGERRRLDLGAADGRPFLNSCVVGLTADASDRTDTESKEQFGTVAYVIETLRGLSSFDGIDVTVTAVGADGERRDLYDGAAALVLVGGTPIDDRAQVEADGGAVDAGTASGVYLSVWFDDVIAAHLVAAHLVARNGIASGRA